MITDELKNLKQIKPKADWVNRERAVLISQITRQNSAVPQSFFVDAWLLMKSLVPSVFLKFVARPIGIFSIVAVMIFGMGMLSVSAARNSLPGELLYPVKLTSEKVKIGFTGSGEQKARLHVEFAEERINEVEKISQSEQTTVKKKEKIKIAADGMKKQMESAQKQLDLVKVTPTDAAEVVNVVKNVDKKTEEISIRIEEKKQSLNIEEDKDLVQTLEEMESATYATSVKAVEVIINKHESGEVGMTEGELISTIEKKIIKAQDKINQAAEKMQKETDRRAAITETLTTEATDSEEKAETTKEDGATDEKSDSAVSTEENKESTENPEKSEELQTSVFDGVKANQAEADQILVEAKNLLSQGDLVSAIEKVKQSNVLANAVTATVNNLPPDEVKKSAVTEVLQAPDAVSTEENPSEPAPISTVK